MRLGIGSYTYPWAVGVSGHPPRQPMTPVALVSKAKALGVRVVQIADNLPLDRLPPADLDALIHRAAEAGIQIELGTRGITPAHLRTYLRLAQRLGSPILRVVIDTADHHPSEDEIVCTLREVIPAFEEAGVCLAIENHDRFPARVLARIIQQVESDCIGICLDTVNSFGALEGPHLVVQTLASWVVNLHIKDFTVRRVDHLMGFIIEGRPAGQGQLDIPWLLEQLRAHGRDPNAVLELWTPPEPSLAATIAKEEAWAADSIAYLRRFIPD